LPVQLDLEVLRLNCAGAQQHGGAYGRCKLSFAMLH
jgi:hypothetical protein